MYNLVKIKIILDLKDILCKLRGKWHKTNLWKHSALTIRKTTSQQHIAPVVLSCYAFFAVVVLEMHNHVLSQPPHSIVA